MRTINWLRKSILIGLGMLSLTKTKAESVARELVKHGQISEKEGRRLAKGLINESKKQTVKFQKILEKEVVGKAAGVRKKRRRQKGKQVKKRKR